MEGKTRLRSGAVAVGFPQFWAWLNEHADCIRRAGAAQCTLYDEDELHWHLTEDADANVQVVQLVWGKRLIGELGIDGDAVLLVRETGATDVDEGGGVLFELIGGTAEEPTTLYHFVVSHGFDGESGHRELKQ